MKGKKNKHKMKERKKINKQQGRRETKCRAKDSTTERKERENKLKGGGDFLCGSMWSNSTPLN